MAGARNFVTERMTIKAATRVLAGFALFASLACHPNSKDITPHQRKAAANLESEAQFAMMMKDYTRAGQLYAKAAELCSDNASYWLKLGSCRRHLGQRAGAKQAYEAALGVYQDAYGRDAGDPQPLLEQVYVLGLLGRRDDARAVLEKIRSVHGGQPTIRGFTNQWFDQMLADPNFTELAL